MVKAPTIVWTIDLVIWLQNNMLDLEMHHLSLSLGSAITFHASRWLKDDEYGKREKMKSRVNKVKSRTEARSMMRVF
jgi:hypothetical protein